MPCYHPLKAFDISAYEGKTRNNKNKLKIVPYSVHHLELKNNKIELVSDDFISPYAAMIFRDYQEIPCGKCIGCRLEYSRQWANRMMCEAQYHAENYFITLTYSDDFVPVSYYANPDTGEALPSLTLSKRDVQLFLKRLRRQTGQQFRYYLCGEYGSHTQRPHYHLIIFGLHLSDLEHYKHKDGIIYYNSETIEKAWSTYDKKTDERISLGHCVVTRVTWETCAYTARYVTKKLNGAMAEVYDTFNIVPEFCLMSRNPGIARQYYEDYGEFIFKNDELYLANGRTVKPMRYFEKLFEVDEPDAASERKERKQANAAASREMLLRQSTLDYQEILVIQERQKEKAIRTLDRSEV